MPHSPSVLLAAAFPALTQPVNSVLHRNRSCRHQALSQRINRRVAFVRTAGSLKGGLR